MSKEVLYGFKSYRQAQTGPVRLIDSEGTEHTSPPMAIYKRPNGKCVVVTCVSNKSDIRSCGQWKDLKPVGIVSEHVRNIPFSESAFWTHFIDCNSKGIPDTRVKSIDETSYYF